MELPSFSRWKQVFKILKKSEKITVLALFILALGSLIFLLSSLYFNYTKIAPASGGIYKEGIKGQPRFINPIYGETNDVDRDLIELIFSGLMSYDKEGGIVKDLVKEYKISEDGKVYEFYLKDNILWHDGKPLTADDVIFTIKTIQNPDYKSPLRTNWLGVETEQISDTAVRFTLKNPYSSFLETCTVKIIPKHIWEDIPLENFTLSPYNLQPIGSGSFKIKSLERTDAGFTKFLNLEANSNYHGKVPFVSKVSFQFFDKKEDLITAFNKGEVDGFSLASLKDYGFLKNKNFFLYSLPLPRYFAVFFNISGRTRVTSEGQKSKIFSEKEVRKALNYAVNKEEIVEKIRSAAPEPEIVQIVESPILPEFFGYQKPSNIYEFNIEKARNLLEKAGFKENEDGIRERTREKKPAFQFKSTLGTGSQGKEVEELQKCLARDLEVYPEGKITGYFGKSTKEAVIRFQKRYVEGIRGTGLVGPKTRAKLNELCLPPSQETLLLQFTLTTVNQSQLIEVAELLKTQWEEIGASVEIEILDISELKPIIKERNYDSLLFGEVLGALPDPFTFWHSSQKNDPGLNLAGYENKEVDKLLKEARETLDENTRKEKYEKFQDILIEDAPSVFLYSPDYLYLVSNKVKGVDTEKIVDPAKRFSNIENWYIQTRRAWK